jgi:Nitrile hydratase, alpha chain
VKLEQVPPARSLGKWRRCYPDHQEDLIVAQDQGRQDQARRFGQLVAAAWADRSLKQRLLESPTAVLAEAGITVPSGTEPRIVENTDRVHYLVLPRQPAADELSNEQLQQVPGGYHSCRPGDDS